MPNRKLEKVKEMIDKRVLIGLTYFNHAGELMEREQMYGKVVSVNPDSVKVELEGLRKGEIMSLPRNLRAFKKADPGVYTLSCSGEEVTDPDYTTEWNITKAPQERKD